MGNLNYFHFLFEEPLVSLFSLLSADIKDVQHCIQCKMWVFEKKAICYIGCRDSEARTGSLGVAPSFSLPQVEFLSPSES